MKTYHVDTISTYLVPYTINSKAYKHAQRPLSMPHRGYVKVDAKTTAQAVTQAHKVVKLPHSIELGKIMEEKRPLEYNSKIRPVEVPLIDVYRDIEGRYIR